MSFFYLLNISTSFVSTLLRLGAGAIATPVAEPPEQLLELYDFEGCPHCRLVREVITELDLDVMILPCPKGGRRFREPLFEREGRVQFPYLVDPNNDVAMFESADIIKYLFSTYGARRTPLRWQLVELQRLGSVLSAMPRPGLGQRVKPSRVPEQPLELYSFEANPFARLVRDLLCELEIAYILRSCGYRWRNQDHSGKVSLPFLIDPNAGIERAGVEQILDYLKVTYG